MTTPDTIDDVADTALWIAAYRARESTRSDALFRDPWAERLAGEKGTRFAARVTGAEQFYWMSVVRTVVIDELLLAAVARGAGTVLNLGAGLDTRPYRLALPSALRWVEVDQRKIVNLKDEVLAAERPNCQLERVAADLGDPTTRRALLKRVAGDHDVVVLTEGVLGYLAEAEVAALADDLRSQPRVSAWIADHSARFLNRTMRARGIWRKHLNKAPLRFQPLDWQGFFLAHGWRLREMRHLPIEGERLGRPLPLPIWFVPIHAVLPKRAREAIRRMIGHGWLEPA